MEKSKTNTTEKSMKDIQIPNWAGFLIIGLVVVIAATFFIMKKAKSNIDSEAGGVATQVAADAVQIDVLPQKVRNFNDTDSGAELANPFESDKLESVRMKGYVGNSSGRATAILETDKSSCIVGIGEKLPNSSWVVKKMTKDSITFSLGEAEKTIYMEQ